MQRNGPGSSGDSMFDGTIQREEQLTKLFPLEGIQKLFAMTLSAEDQAQVDKLLKKVPLQEGTKLTAGALVDGFYLLPCDRTIGGRRDDRINYIDIYSIPLTLTTAHPSLCIGLQVWKGEVSLGHCSIFNSYDDVARLTPERAIREWAHYGVSEERNDLAMLVGVPFHAFVNPVDRGDVLLNAVVPNFRKILGLRS